MKDIYSVKNASTPIYVSSPIVLFVLKMFTCPVSQKKDIQRQKTKLEALKQEAEEEKARAKEAARERVLLDFEKGQLRLAGTPGAVATSGAKTSANSDEREHSVVYFNVIWWFLKRIRHTSERSQTQIRIRCVYRGNTYTGG
jgi:hypothetical protein